MGTSNGAVPPSSFENLTEDFVNLLREEGSGSSRRFFGGSRAVDASADHSDSNYPFLSHHCTPAFSEREPPKCAYGVIGDCRYRAWSYQTPESRIFSRDNTSMAGVVQSNLPRSSPSDQNIQRSYSQSSDFITGPRSETVLTASQTFTASGLQSFDYSPIQGLHSHAAVNGGIYGDERLKQRSFYFEQKYRGISIFPRGHHGNFASDQRDTLRSRVNLGSGGDSTGFRISDIVGRVAEVCVNQTTSRILQDKLDSASLEEKKMIFPEILFNALQLVTHVFGNYVIQRFLEHGNDVQRKQLVREFRGHVLTITLQVYGCRVIQKALKYIDVDLGADLVSELESSVIRCSRDRNGNHVIQKSVECIPEDKLRFITDELRGNVVRLSLNPYGCRVIQKVLECCIDANTQKNMMHEILDSLFDLANDRHGNYVIQHVLEHGTMSQRSAIVRKLAGKIAELSKHKFSSNVVEKCLAFCTPAEHKTMVREMVTPVNGSVPPLMEIMEDQFGNYVVQNTLRTGDDTSRAIILSMIRAHVGSSKPVSAGVKKIISVGEKFENAAMSPRKRGWVLKDRGSGSGVRNPNDDTKNNFWRRGKVGPTPLDSWSLAEVNKTDERAR